MNYNIVKTIDNPNYKKYTIISENIAGRIVLEKYGDIWNLELMNVVPTNSGHGTKFLTYVLKAENLIPRNMTVCPTSEGSKRFFRRFGFNV